MSDFKRETDAFHALIRRIGDYGVACTRLADQMRGQLDMGLDVPDDIAPLIADAVRPGQVHAFETFLRDTAVSMTQAQAMFRALLKEANVNDAVTQAKNFGGNFYRMSEGIVNDAALGSEAVLNDPYSHVRPEVTEIVRLFPREIGAPLDTREKLAFAEFLRSPRNPWV